MKKNNSRFILLAFCWIVLSSFHEYHVSIFDIAYDSSAHSMQVTEKIFVDDLEKALLNEGKKGLEFEEGKENKEADTYLAKYLNSRFMMEVNGEALELQFIGKEWEDYHTLLCYFEAENVQAVDSIKISNRVFIELFNDQENMHNLEINGVKKSIVLNKMHIEAHWKLAQ